jgi:predicted oxidoreductase
LLSIAQRLKVYLNSLAIAWLLAYPANIIPAMGSKRLERIQQFHAAYNVPINRQTMV